MGWEAVVGWWVALGFEVGFSFLLGLGLGLLVLVLLPLLLLSLASAMISTLPSPPLPVMMFETGRKERKGKGGEQPTMDGPNGLL